MCFRPSRNHRFATAAVLVLLICAPASTAQQPNIVLILADDLGWHQTGCYGTDFYETPHVDLLAEQGMRFTDAYAACPVCSPTRASIMTGKYPARLHLTDFISGDGKKNWPNEKLQVPDWTMELPLAEQTLAEALKSVGYATGHFGKWHLNKDKNYKLGRPGDPGSQGFDDVLTTHKPGAGPPSKYDHDAHHVREITERAIEFIKRHHEVRGAAPFFCYLAHNSIHRPITERQELIQKYRDKEGSERADHNPIVAAMVQTLDESVGLILDQLAELDLASSTIVIYVSDNGCMWGPELLKPLRGGKAELYEGGIRVPLIARWPGHVAPGSTCRVPVTTVDLFPTLLEAAGKEVTDQTIDGESLLPLLEQTGDLQRDAIYWHYPHYHSLAMAPAGVIRQGRYKLIEWFERSIDGIETECALELYDLEQDISEQRDLAAEQPELVSRLYEKLNNWRVSVGAQAMLRNPSSPR